jgi:hypothetical protein
MPPKRAVVAAAIASCVGFAGAAHADPARDAILADAPLTERSASPRLWYGWQTLSLDGAALAVGLAAASVHDDHAALGVTLVAAGLSSYSLSAPVVHWLHERPGAAGVSLALRIGLPLMSVGILSGSSAARCPGTGARDDERYCERMERTLVIAGSLSLLAASLVDAATLGWESRPPRAAASPALMPVLAWDGLRGATAGFGGAF